jgi:hypothetical protein
MSPSVACYTLPARCRHQFVFTLCGGVLSSVSEAKDLRITLSDNYGTRSSQRRAHILEMVSKANQCLGFLHRNLRGSPYKLREMAYLSLVQSSQEYCCSIWDPTVKQEEDMVEIVQRRAARWVRGAYGIISVTALLRDLGWLSLTDQRRNRRLCLFYKILHGDLDIKTQCCRRPTCG